VLRAKLLPVRDPKLTIKLEIPLVDEVSGSVPESVAESLLLVALVDTVAVPVTGPNGVVPTPVGGSVEVEPGAKGSGIDSWLVPIVAVKTPLCGDPCGKARSRRSRRYRRCWSRPGRASYALCPVHSCS
jgi:hypothetical protein